MYNKSKLKHDIFAPFYKISGRQLTVTVFTIHITPMASDKNRYT